MNMKEKKNVLKLKINSFEEASGSKLDDWDCEAHSVPEQWAMVIKIF